MTQTAGDRRTWTMFPTEPETVTFLAALAHAIGARMIVELGTGDGDTAARIAAMVGGAEVHTVELDEGAYRAARDRHGGDVYCWNADAAVWTPPALVDLLYVDDDPGTRVDRVRRYRPLMSRRGVIAVHDTKRLGLRVPGGVELSTAFGLTLVEP